MYGGYPNSTPPQRQKSKIKSKSKSKKILFIVGTL